jgi:Na+-driven multidrug efflux pump
LVFIAGFFPEQFLGMFTNEKALIQETIPTLFLIFGSLMIYTYANTLMSAVSGSGRTDFTLLIEFLTITFYLFAAWFVAIKLKGSVIWVWSVEYVYFLFMILFSSVVLRRLLKKYRLS